MSIGIAEVALLAIVLGSFGLIARRRGLLGGLLF